MTCSRSSSCWKAGAAAGEVRAANVRMLLAGPEESCCLSDRRREFKPRT